MVARNAERTHADLPPFAGLPADVANGTNRVGILIQNSVASWGFWREGVPGFAQAAPLVVPVVAGAVCGAYGISQLPADAFQRAFGVVMLLLLVPTLRGARSAAGARARAVGSARAAQRARAQRQGRAILAQPAVLPRC